jgi:predicted secreted protein
MTPRSLRCALLLALLVAACSTGGSFPSDKVLTEANAGMVLMRVGEQFSVKLAANPSTGYAWHGLISNENMLIRQGEPVFAGDTETFTYRIVAGGETQLRFEYKRALDSEKSPKVVVFDLVVN